MMLFIPYWHAGDMRPGDVCYLIEINGGFAIQRGPGLTNVKGRSVWRGWLGETNNQWAWAVGACEVVELAKDRLGFDGVRVRRLPDDDPRVAELIDQCEFATN